MRARAAECEHTVSRSHLHILRDEMRYWEVVVFLWLPSLGLYHMG